MGWTFWALLLAGIVLVTVPFFASLSAALAVMLWMLGALSVIAAFFLLPAWWARTAPVPGPQAA